MPSQRRRRTSRRCRGRSPPNFRHVGRANPPIFVSNFAYHPLKMAVARQQVPATAHARAWASTKTFLVGRRRQPPVTRPATSMDVTSHSWLLLRVEGGTHVAAPPGVVTDAAFERGSLMWACSKGDWWFCAVLPLGARATDRARRAHGLDRRPLSPRHSQRSLMRHCPGRHLGHEG